MAYRLQPGAGRKKYICGARNFSDLPKAAQDYVLYLEAKLGCPIDFVSVGAERDQIILR